MSGASADLLSAETELQRQGALLSACGSLSQQIEEWRSRILGLAAAVEAVIDFADEDDVVVLRTVQGQRIAGLYNIEAIRRGLYDDPPIYANDLVVVGDSPQRRLFRDFISLAPLLAAPIVAVLQR